MSTLIVLVLLTATVSTVCWTFRETHRLRQIRDEAKATDDPGRLRYLYWLIDHPEFKPRRKGDT